MDASTRAREPVSISVIIPTQDRPEDIRRCLTGLANQDNRDALEQVIVVDDHSRSPYLNTVQEQGAALGLPVLTVAGSGPRGAAPARNRAAALATGNVLAFLDDDAIPQPGWLRALVRVFEDDACSVVTGRILPCEPQDTLSRARQVRYDLRRASALAGSGKVKFMAGGNGAVRRELFERLEGFDTRMVQMHDSELILRLMYLGLSCDYVDDLVIRHRHSKGWKQMFEVCFRAARSRRIMEGLHASTPRFTLHRQVRSVTGALRYCLRHDRPSTMFGIVVSECTHRLGYAWYGRVRPLLFESKIQQRV